MHLSPAIFQTTTRLHQHLDTKSRGDFSRLEYGGHAAKTQKRLRCDLLIFRAYFEDAFLITKPADSAFRRNTDNAIMGMVMNPYVK